MTDRVELHDEEMDDVVGGALVWSSEGVYAKDNPSVIYKFGDYKLCREYIRTYWKGGAQTSATLQMLKDAGLIWLA